ncbi:MAG: Asp-tRNA(Asn)/Glu-tRNA(Gln) amidotransferase subunit GatC [Roseburia sp.]|nr:Asp-tRNA(Asn)/Glu-tRNA(Gln) amidotransferase subunit GatC [Roseburia sp.]
MKDAEISTEETKHIAELSRLEFTHDELEDMRLHLQKQIQYFEILDSVDISGVPPTAHILDAVNVLRDDIAAPSMPNDEILGNAPESDGGAYVVPRVVE